VFKFSGFNKSPVKATLSNGTSPLLSNQGLNAGNQNIPFANTLISLIFAAIFKL
jgi:hypothetical protein